MITGEALYSQITSPNKDRLVRVAQPRLIVLHSTEGHEKEGSARNVASWFRNPLSKVSAHLVIDPSEIIQCVPFNYTAWHAGAVNPISIGIELCGTAKQSAAQWLDTDSIAMLQRAATCVADLLLAFNIELRLLTDPELAISKKDPNVSGICTHAAVSRVFGGTHWDPGPSFPMQDFLIAVQGYRQIKIAQGLPGDAS